MKDGHLESKDLMIGDWISFRGHLFRVNFPMLERINSGVEVDPIPLTPEILEKNGFVFDHDVFDGIYPMINIIYCDYKLLVDDGKYIDGGENKNILYVHELQHALRLCGLTDLADNFKV